MSRKSIPLFLIAVLIPFAQGIAQSNDRALSVQEIERLLRWFETDTKNFMERDPSGEGQAQLGILVDGFLLEAKNEARDKLVAAAQVDMESSPNEAIEHLVDPRDLVETGGRILRDPREIDSRGYSKAKYAPEAWSGSIWSQYRGHSAQRYTLERASTASSWLRAWEFITSPRRTYYEVVKGTASSTAGKIEDLGPAEKYDLLISVPDQEPAGLLAKYEWAQGKKKQDQFGSVATWFGYCHGWAGASMLLERPLHAITVPSADGTIGVRLYPDDIKAMATVLWANSLPKLKLIGRRCETADPPRDENGRIIDSKCLDVNPATFHMALVNQIGVGKRPLVIDATYDQQVWNQPIVSYSYTYFNPQTKSAGGSFEANAIPIETFANDKFQRYRSPLARKVVGVALEVEYARSSTPSHRHTDDPSRDKRKKMAYLYDLEIGASGQIIGGEWYQLRHPDFLWTPARGARAVSDFEDRATTEWMSGRTIPSQWRGPAALAAARGQPLAKLVDKLIALARE